MEWTWDPDHGMTWFDISNVEGRPFMNEGQTTTV
ncbi:uncharacterized protein HMPREF1541_07853, partial [Cyphellophora europaea CBS 101466]